jgi:glycosyltransferase involved in cell wall biosynthesis
VQATVVMLGDGRSERRDRLEAHGIEVVTLPSSRRGPARAGTMAARLLRLVRAQRPDVLYAWLEESALLAAPVTAVTRTPFVVSRRNVAGSSIEHVRILRRLMLAAEGSAAVVTVNSEAGRAFALTRGICEERIRLVRNGHPPGAVQPLPPAEPLVFGYLGRLRPEKGHRRLLDVLSRVDARARGRVWRVRLGGDGPLEAELRAEVARRGLSHVVEFCGLVSDVPSFWAGVHVGVLLSDHEGQPNALIEAAMHGRPAIATHVGGSPEVVLPAGGVTVPVDDPDAAAAAFLAYMEDPARVARDGAAAFEQARERFEIQASVDGHLAALGEAISRSARPSRGRKGG